MRLLDYVSQDIRLRYKDNGVLKNILRYYRLPSFKLLVNYRFVKFLSQNKNGGFG